jgi:hypothetical protein
MVGLTDWFATIAAIVGQRPPDTSGLDSMNLLPVLRGEAQQVRSHLLIDTCVNGIARGIRIGSWVYIDRESGDLNGGRNKEPPWFRELRGVVDVPGAELYDLAADLGQGKNRIAAEPARASSPNFTLSSLVEPQSVREIVMLSRAAGISGLMSKPPGGFVSARMNSRHGKDTDAPSVRQTRRTIRV